MKQLLSLTAVLALGAATTALALDSDDGIKLKGPHFNLNLIGHPNCNSNGSGDNDGHTIHMALFGRTIIKLAEGDFGVVDANGCDGTAAFTLPAQSCDALSLDPDPDPNNTIPCVDNDSNTESYLVFARSLGKPAQGDQNITITTCAHTTDGTKVCSTENLVSVRMSGKQTFKNVTKELTSICLDTTVPPDGTCDLRVALFDEMLQDWFWQVDNDGNRLLQLRFYRTADLGL